MPFRRSGGFRRWPGRRFSATPRRSWGRSRVGTGTTKRQYAQMSIRTSLTAESGTTTQAPSFLIQSLVPWANAPEGGYDRSWELRGLVWQYDAWVLSHTPNEGSQTDGPFVTTDYGGMVGQMCSMFFVDQTDVNGAPVSMLDIPRGPFITTAPIANTSAPQDDEFMPTRILRRKSGGIRGGVNGTGDYFGNAFFPNDGVSNFRWSGVLRKRISIASRQGLFLGHFVLSPPSGWGPGVDNVDIWIQGTLFYYYRLAR